MAAYSPHRPLSTDSVEKVAEQHTVRALAVEIEQLVNNFAGNAL
jgi:hypothetical protein